MINIVYRLVSPKLIEEDITELNDLETNVIVRPLYLSICKADQRYYYGKRGLGILNKKLPMALIHEGVGEVIRDNTGTFNSGDKVVMIPNIPNDNNDLILENYMSSSKFRSSDCDGFLMDYVNLPPDRLIKVPEDFNLKIASFIELISVSVHAYKRFIDFSHSKRETIGIWGDGIFGYITALILKLLLPESKIIVFGLHSDKLNFFTFVDETYLVNDVPNDLTIDHGFECVGKDNSSLAINQIIDLINPQGTISILGVSENPIQINTRLILEKGLSIHGSSRSTREDFVHTIELLEKFPNALPYLENIINEIDIKTLNDVNKAFNLDLTHRFGKTVLCWNK